VPAEAYNVDGRAEGHSRCDGEGQRFSRVDRGTSRMLIWLSLGIALCAGVRQIDAVAVLLVDYIADRLLWLRATGFVECEHWSDC
jgi:hypothetical protein